MGTPRQRRPWQSDDSPNRATVRVYAGAVQEVAVNQTPTPVRFSMELYFDEEVRRWAFDGEVRYGDGKDTGIVGGTRSGTLRDAQREAIEALNFTLDSLREDGLLPADPAESAAAAS